MPFRAISWTALKVGNQCRLVMTRTRMANGIAPRTSDQRVERLMVRMGGGSHQFIHVVNHSSPVSRRFLRELFIRGMCSKYGYTTLLNSEFLAKPDSVPEWQKRWGGFCFPTSQGGLKLLADTFRATAMAVPARATEPELRPVAGNATIWDAKADSARAATATEPPMHSQRTRLRTLISGQN